MLAVVLLAAIATAAADPTEGCKMENVNQLTDFMITHQKQTEKITTVRNFENASLSLSSGEAEARNVTLRGVDSLYRSGDCFLCDTAETHMAYLELGWRSLELTTGALALEKGGLPFAACFRLRGVSVKVVLGNSGNDPVVEKLEVLTLGDKVEMSASNPDYDGKDVAGLAKEFVLPYVNNRLDQLRQELNKNFHHESSEEMFKQILQLLM